MEQKTTELAQIGDLIKAQAQLYNDVLDGKVKHYIAKEATNAAGKIIGACKVQLEYALLRQERPNIPFLGGEMTPMEVKYHAARKELAEEGPTQTKKHA